VEALLAELEELQKALGGRAVVTGAGWPAGLEARLPGEEPAVEYPCPYGNFSHLRDEGDADYRDLLNRHA
jgi:hypothetical protein